MSSDRHSGFDPESIKEKLMKVKGTLRRVFSKLLARADFSLPLYLKKESREGYSFIGFKVGTTRSLQTWALTFLLCIGVISPTLWFFSSGYRKLIPSILGIEEVTYELPSQRTFASGYDDVNSIDVLVSDTEVQMSAIDGWWNEDYSGRKSLTINNLSGETDGSQLANSTVTLTINTKELYDNGHLQDDCDDLRIVYTTDSENFTELSRSYIKTSTSTNCSDSVATQISFPLQADIANLASDENYYLYYGNANAESPAYGDNGYDIGDKHATLVCPFNGTTTCVDGETPTTETGAIRYSGAMGSALSFDGVNDQVVVADSDSVDFNETESFTIEFWMRPDMAVSGYKMPIMKRSGGAVGNVGYIIEVDTNTGAIVFDFSDGADSGQIVGTGLTRGAWHHIVAVVDRDANQAKLFLDGTQKGSTINITAVGNLSNDRVLGIASNGTGSYYLKSMMDELRISDTVRYTSNFTPSTAPFEPDANTKLLLHFDENGDDPRFTGKAIDSSGNGNHGTITGAKYVDGLVGVNPQSANVSASSFASHQGVFIEEGTTNYVDNPSFENNITDFWSGKSAVTAYTSGATDADGNAYLGNNNVNDVYFYDTANDSAAATQVTLGVDPNWRKGVVLKTGTLSTTNNGSLIEVTGTNANGNAVEITIASATTFNWTDGGSYSGTGVAMDKGNWVQLETGTDDIYVRFSSTGTFTNNNVFRINSWVIEPFSATRGKRRDFPEQAWLVVTDGSLDIIDATEDKLWMRFINGVSNYMIQAGYENAVFALNGEILVGSSSLHKISMAIDNGYVHNATNEYVFKSNITKRNNDIGWTSINSLGIVNIAVNDVHAAVINNKQYVAVATDGGVSVINETAGSVVDFYYPTDEFVGSVFLTSDALYFTFNIGTTTGPWRLGVIYTDSSLWTTGSTSMAASYKYEQNNSNPPCPYIKQYSSIQSIYVTEETSKVDGTSNTVYLGMDGRDGSSGMFSVLQEKQGDESNGSVKYYTKDEITEELIGDIRGAWGFNTNATLANGNDVQDVSVRDADLTAVADAGGISVVNGVRGKAFTFDGTNDYLTQKVYDDQTGASWGPTYHGLSLASGHAFARVQGVSLAPYANAANTYMLVVKDPEGDVAWGYIDTAGGGETLGSELITNGGFETYTGTQDDGVSDTIDGWSTSVITADATADSNSGSSGLRLINSGVDGKSAMQTVTTTVGALYKVSFVWKSVSGQGYNMYITGIGNPYVTDSAPSEYTPVTFYFTANATSTLMHFRGNGIANGGEIKIDNVSVKQVTSPATDGVKIMSTKGGTTQAWAGISASFNYNASAYTFEVRKTDFQITGDLTMGAWVKTSALATQYLINKNGYESGGYRSFYTRFNTNGTLTFALIGAEGSEATTSTNSYADNTWHYVTSVYSPSNSLRLYVDGVEVANSTTGIASSMYDVYDSFVIGVRSYDKQYRFSGTIDEPFITAEALSSTQIKNMFDTGCRAMGGTPGTGTCTGINEAGTTNNLAGSVNIVNAVTTNPTGTLGFVATDGATGAVSVLDLTADKLVKTISTATTPALVNNDSTALAVARFDNTNPQLIVGSDAAGVSVINNDLTAETQNTSTAYSEYGTDSLKIDNSVSATHTLYKFTETLTAANYTYSFYAYTDGNQVTSADIVPYVNNGEVLTNVTYEDAGGGWTRVYGTFRGFAASNIFGVKVKAGKTVYIDGVQLEAKAYPTTYADGSLGTGYSWSGTANNSSSTRNSTVVGYSSENNFNPNVSSISFWMKPDRNMNDGRYHFLFSDRYVAGSYGSPNMVGIFKNNTNGLTLKVNGENGDRSITYSSPNFEKDYLYNIVAVWDNSTPVIDDKYLALYVNGSLVASGVTNTTTVSTGTTFNIGSSYHADATLSDLRIFDQALTAAEVTDLYYQGLQTHGVTETKGRYDGITDASYYSGRIDLGAASAWSEGDDLTIASTLNGGTISYFTCTKSLITGTCAEEDYLPIVGNEIQSNASRYMFVKTVLNSADTFTTPVLTGLTFNYAPDSNAPTNPTEIHAYSTSTKETEYQEVDYGNSNRPYFEWPQAEEVGGASDSGEGSSGVNGYYVYFGEDDTASPQTAGTYQIESEEGNNHYQLPVEDALTDKGNYYLRIQSMDNAGSIQSTVWEAYTYQYDNEEPNNPSGVSVTPAGWSKVNSYEFYWPTGADDDSQLWGYCYKTGDPEVEEVCIEDNSVQNITAYQAGENIFYLRSMDNAGNKNTNFIQTTYYYNADAPSSPNNLDVTPDTSDENEFTFTWDAPSDFNGEIKGYYYSINTEPTIDNSIFTTETQVGPGPYATRQGENKFYVLAEDTAGNKNFDIYSEVSFYANTTAPGIPTGLKISDSSDRENSRYSLTIEWNEIENVYRYNVYRSTDGETFTQASETDATAYIDTGLNEDITYSYYITGEDSAGAESGHSQTVSKKPSGKFTTPPTITVNPTATAGRTSSTITWETDRESNSFVQIGTQDVYTRTQGQWITSKQHSVELKGLNPATVYHYRVQSIDDPELIDYDSNEAFSQDYTFTTGEIPKIKDLEVKEVRHSSAIVTWGTDVTSTSVVYLTGGEERTIEDQSSGGTTTHTILVDNLSAGTSYNVRVSGTDEEGNTLIGEEHSFTTPAYPKISEVRLEQQKEEAEGTVKVTWITNVATTSVVKYNKKGETETVETSNSELVTEHEMIASGLQDNSEYEILVEGRDGYGNLAQSEVNTFLTDVDTRPPKIENVLIETGLIGSGTKAKAQIIVSWETDELSSSQVEYDIGIGETDGTVTYAQKTKEDNGLVNKHVVVISELSPSQVYRVRLLSKDKSGNETYSDNNIVVTDEATENALELVMNSLLETFGWLFGE